MDFSAEELKNLELSICFSRSSYSEVPKLIMPTVSNPSCCSSTTGTNNPMDAFKKGIKHETSQYPVLKDACFFDKFEMEFMTLTHVHDIEEIFDTKYMSLMQAEKDLLDEKLKFAMSVLVQSMKTNVGITLVRKYYMDCKAQECWHKIQDEATCSTCADLELMMLQDKLFSTRIDTNWHGDVEGFLLYWNGLLVKIEEILPIKQHYTWEMKKLLLHSAVNGHPHLASVDKLDHDQIMRGQAPMNFEAYFSMLQNAAQQVDHENRANKHPVKRAINYLDFTPDEFEELSSPPSVAELNVSKVQAKPPFRPREDVQDPSTLHVPYELFTKLPP